MLCTSSRTSFFENLKNEFYDLSNKFSMALITRAVHRVTTACAALLFFQIVCRAAKIRQERVVMFWMWNMKLNCPCVAQIKWHCHYTSWTSLSTRPPVMNVLEMHVVVCFPPSGMLWRCGPGTLWWTTVRSVGTTSWISVSSHSFGDSPLNNWWPGL